MPLYKADPNDDKKQIPNNPIQGNQYSNATCPTNEVVSKRPTYVNCNSVGTYAFLYETTASVGGETPGEIAKFVTGSQVVANHGNIKLDISPVAWRRTDDTDAVGQVTFVYVRVR
jgi:hypothetical protein